jgi:tetratricopeptide (TPR) repeat protein
MISFKPLLAGFFLSLSITTYAQFRLYEKGHDFYKAGNYVEAVNSLTEYLTKAHRDKAIDIDVFYIRGLSHYKSDHFKEAIPDFEETLLRGHANKGNIYWFMAKCYDHLSNNEEALNSYTNAIRELADKPESKAKLLYERSLIHSRMGNLIQSQNDLREGLNAQPSNADIKKALEKIPVAMRQTEGSDKAKDNSKAKDNNKEGTATPIVDDANVSVADAYADEKRYALVIGNSKYPKEIGMLRNPVNDASDIAKELKNSNFDVTLLTDATYGQIRAALMKFKENLDGGDRDKTVGLFYYAGHGLQFDDENYMVPVDASVAFEDDIPRYCFPINRMVLANMERANTRMNIVILDACRNNPFPALNRSLNNSGLGEMKRARGSFIAYATSPGSVASDGAGRNGLYTQELLKAMRKPGLTIEQVFKEVRANVLKLSSNKQNTWDSSNIIGEFHFRLE